MFHYSNTFKMFFGSDWRNLDVMHQTGEPNCFEAFDTFVRIVASSILYSLVRGTLTRTSPLGNWCLLFNTLLTILNKSFARKRKCKVLVTEVENPLREVLSEEKNLGLSARAWGIRIKYVQSSRNPSFVLVLILYLTVTLVLLQYWVVHEKEREDGDHTRGKE